MKTANQLRASKHQHAVEYTSCDTALEEANKLARMYKMPIGIMTVAITAYHNTLLEVLAVDTESQQVAKNDERGINGILKEPHESTRDISD